MKRIYLASPLFTISEQFWNEIVAEQLRAAGFEVFNPQSDNTANDKDNPNVEVSAKSIYEGDFKEIEKADIIVANIDGLSIDSGLTAEVGVFSMMMKQNPEKYLGIVTYRSDIRRNGEGDQRFYFNQYVVGLLNECGPTVDINVPEDKLNVFAYKLEAQKIVEAVKGLC